MYSRFSSCKINFHCFNLFLIKGIFLCGEQAVVSLMGHILIDTLFYISRGRRKDFSGKSNFSKQPGLQAFGGILKRMKGFWNGLRKTMYKHLLASWTWCVNYNIKVVSPTLKGKIMVFFWERKTMIKTKQDKVNYNCNTLKW